MYAFYPVWRPYNYVLGNPLSLIDPWGLAPCEAGTEALEDGMPCYQSETITVTAMREGGIFMSSLMFPPKNRGLSFQDYTDEHGRNVTRISADASTPKGAGAMYGHWRSRSSEACNVASGGGNFSAQARSIAMRACIHAGQNAFLTQSLIISGTTLGALALATTGVGVVAGSYGLIAAGSAFGTGATILNSSASFSEGNIGAGFAQGLLGVATGGTITAVQRAKSLNAIDRTILNSTTMIFDSFGNAGFSVYRGKR